MNEEQNYILKTYKIINTKTEEVLFDFNNKFSVQSYPTIASESDSCFLDIPHRNFTKLLKCFDDNSFDTVCELVKSDDVSIITEFMEEQVEDDPALTHTYRYRCDINSSNGIIKESYEFDSKKIIISQDEFVSFMWGLTSNQDENNLISVFPDIPVILKKFNSVLLSCITTLHKQVELCIQSRFVVPDQYHLSYNEDATIKSIAESLLEQYNIPVDMTISTLNLYTPALGFGVDKVTKEGFIMGDGVIFGPRDMGTGAMILSVLLPIAVYGINAGKLILAGDISSGIHPLLEEFLINNFNDLGQTIRKEKKKNPGTVLVISKRRDIK